METNEMIVIAIAIFLTVVIGVVAFIENRFRYYRGYLNNKQLSKMDSTNILDKNIKENLEIMQDTLNKYKVQLDNLVKLNDKNNAIIEKQNDLIKTLEDAKRVGKKIPANSEYLKEDYKLSIMKKVMELKYKIPLFRAYLLSTKDQEIVHDVYHNDTFFGKTNGVGSNHLGTILMDIRKKLKQEIIDSNFKDNKLLPLEINKASLRIAGIGSRDLPGEIKVKIEDIMLYLNSITNNKLIVHTGDANGSDLCFKANAKNCISYLPFKGFNNSTSDKFTVCNKAVTLASFHHPYFDTMKSITKQLMGRNVYQIMSDTFSNIVDCVICYTPDGVEKSKDVTVGKTGGTGLAISLADTIGIPVFNLANSDSVTRIKEFYSNIEENKHLL